jgi:hypothetical protein
MMPIQAIIQLGFGLIESSSKRLILMISQAYAIAIFISVRYIQLSCPMPHARCPNTKNFVPHPNKNRYVSI